MRAGTTNRQHLHTLLCEAGSSRITAGNAIQSQFGSSIDVFVFDSPADATSAVLQVRRLDVNKPLGDSGSFYDFPGAYEYLAFLNQADALYLSATPAVEPVSGIASNDSVGQLVVRPVGICRVRVAAQEDNYPQPRDHDFNDRVVAYRHELGLDARGRVIRVEVKSCLAAEGPGSHSTGSWSRRWRAPAPRSGGAPSGEPASRKTARSASTAAGSTPCPSAASTTGANT